MAARISRESLDDNTLTRAVAVLRAQMGTLGSLQHRFRDTPEVAYELNRDDDALSAVLGILLNEQRSRRIEDQELEQGTEGA